MIKFKQKSFPKENLIINLFTLKNKAQMNLLLKSISTCIDKILILKNRGIININLFQPLNSGKKSSLSLKIKIFENIIFN